MAGPHPTTAPRQAAILFIRTTVKLDVLSFVDRKAHRPHKRRVLFVHLLAWPHWQGVRSSSSITNIDRRCYGRAYGEGAGDPVLTVTQDRQFIEAVSLSNILRYYSGVVSQHVARCS